jgi:hypothetical protein
LVALMTPFERHWRIRDNKILAEEGPVPLEETQRRRELQWMTVGMNITAVLAGAYAGIGGALLVVDGAIQWSNGSEGLYMIAGAAGVVLVVGIVGVDHLMRPWHRWIDEAGALRQRLRRMSTDPELDPHELQMAEATFQRLRRTQFRNPRVRLLLRLGVIAPEAAREWRGGSWDSTRLRRAQILRYSIVSRGTSSLYLLSALVCLVAWSWDAVQRLGGDWWKFSLGILIILVLVWPLTLISARPTLVLENRELARQRVWLTDCGQRLRALKVPAEAPKPAGPPDRLWLQVGSWALIRRSNATGED